MRPELQRYLALGPLLLSTLVGATAVSSAERTCQSFYEIEIEKVDGARKPEPRVRFGFFETTGTCGSTLPDRCRSRAIQTANKCMQAHWDHRHDRNEVPRECKGSGVIGYTTWDLKDEIELTACCSPGSEGLGGDEIELDVFKFTHCRSGNIGQVREKLVDDYKAICDSHRMQRLCFVKRNSGLQRLNYEPLTDRGGSDFNQLSPRTAAECKSACAETRSCKAWTHVTATRTCFLKNAVPSAVFNPCCTSGVQ